MRSGLPYGNASAAIWPCQARGCRARAAFAQPMTQPACPRCRHSPWAPCSACKYHDTIRLNYLNYHRPTAPQWWLNSNNPDAVLIGLGVGGVMQSPGVRAAHVAEMDVASFVAHLGRMGIAAIRRMAL